MGKKLTKPLTNLPLPSCKKKAEVSYDPSLKQYDVGNKADWEEEQVKEINITKDYTILVYNHDGKFYAFGSRCPHKGAPLIKGAIIDGTVKCALHGAEFNIETGDVEDYPAFDCIPAFPVIVVKGVVKVLMKAPGVYTLSRPLKKVTSPKIAVAIGSGASSVSFAQSLREGGWDGRILLISKEKCMPYDKTRLSETVNLSADNISIRNENWYQKLNIEVRLNTPVTSLDMGKRKLFMGSDSLTYTKLFIGTGSRGKLPSPRLVVGMDLPNVFTISNIEEAQQVYDQAKNKNVVIEGSGFISMELVSTLKNHAKQCFIVTRSKRPFQNVLGETIGRAFQKLLVTETDVEFFCYDEIRKIVGQGGHVKKVITLKKREIICDLVVYAIGSVPNSELFSQDRRALVSKTGHIVVTEFCETNVADVYAGGDVALVPLDCAVTGTATIAHWNFASYTGKIAAGRILRINESIKSYVPFFYTTFCGITLRYTGYGDNYDESIIFGDLYGNIKFCVLYRRERKILACATVNADPIAARVCFNIGDHYQWDHGRYPKIITDIFTELPVHGEEYFGFKLDREKCITLFDSQSATEDPVKRKEQQFHALQYRDVEFPLGLAEDKQMNFAVM